MSGTDRHRETTVFHQAAQQDVGEALLRRLAAGGYVIHRVAHRIQYQSGKRAGPSSEPAQGAQFITAPQPVRSLMAGYADMKRTIVGRSARLATLREPPMNGLIDLLRRHLVSDAPPLTRAERWRSTIAGFLGLLLFEGVLFVLPLAPDEKRLLAPIGATSIIVFMLPHSPLAQPWSIIGGLMISAPLGYACGYWLPAGPWVSGHRAGRIDLADRLGALPAPAGRRHGADHGHGGSRRCSVRAGHAGCHGQHDRHHGRRHGGEQPDSGPALSSGHTTRRAAAA
jgi:hypothetical protein